jgi:hypothetical protein
VSRSSFVGRRILNAQAYGMFGPCDTLGWGASENMKTGGNPVSDIGDNTLLGSMFPCECLDSCRTAEIALKFVPGSGQPVLA